VEDRDVAGAQGLYAGGIRLEIVEEDDGHTQASLQGRPRKGQVCVCQAEPAAAFRNGAGRRKPGRQDADPARPGGSGECLERIVKPSIIPRRDDDAMANRHRSTPRIHKGEAAIRAADVSCQDDDATGRRDAHLTFPRLLL